MLKRLKNLTQVEQLLLAMLAVICVLVVVVWRTQQDAHNATVNQEVNSVLADRAACVGSALRSVYNLQIDYAIYRADYTTAHDPKSSPSQMKIRGEEAAFLLKYMEKIAANRLQASYADELPSMLSSIVQQTGFSCTLAFPLPSGAKATEEQLRPKSDGITKH
jgi:hypothetical protein